ncbi:MAG: DUF3316 domain-containing protein [Bacteroidales bacterium]|nr:DUF3316 domain-containing protein [Bacteroidales bacterium]
MRTLMCNRWPFIRVAFWIAVLAFPLSRMSAQGTDSPPAPREFARSLLVGGGLAHTLDTYLTPLEYTGGGACIVFEQVRGVRRWGRTWLSQHWVQADYTYTHNPAKSAYMHSGMLQYAYSLQRPFPLTSWLTGTAGPQVEAGVGGIYNHRNSNNPAQAKATLSLGAAARLTALCRVGSVPLRVAWQAHLPLVGLAFSPQYGESYYEMFSLGEGGWHNVVFTSLHNRPTFRQLLSVDVPVGRGVCRVGWLADIRQTRIHHLKYHSWTHSLLVGYVRHFRLLDARREYRSTSFFY